MQCSRRHFKRSRRAGSALLDGMLAVLIIGMGAAGFFGLFPHFTRTQIGSSDESKAVQMAQRMIEHLQLLKPADLNAETLGDLDLIDEGQEEQPFTFSSIPLDDGTGYSPSRALKNGTAEMEVEDLPAGCKRVTITIGWTSPNSKSRQVTMGTVLGGFR